ncbi:MAG: phytase [Bryobacteraceae bacterium]|nr:phytase [Bryobacteraceae bacterium]MCX7604137.1 phytase [Bryobacteraceae bacterium]
MFQTMRFIFVLLSLGFALAALLPAPVAVKPAAATDPAGDDADDPAIWVHPKDPARSLVIGTNKAAAPRGALVVYGLDGRARQRIEPLDRPNNVDVEYGLRLAGRRADIAVVTERYQKRLRVFRIDEKTGTLEDVSSGGGIAVFEGREGRGREPMGIALYRRPRDGAVFAIVSPKEGPMEGYLEQYLLEDDGTGRVRGRKVRAFGAFSGAGEIEAVAVDDELGYVYYADEDVGLRKYHADPDHPLAAKELAFFGRQGYQGNREGLAIYATAKGKGFLISTDQIRGNSRYLLYRREGTAADAHDHSEVVAVLEGGADATDGIDATARPLGRAFPRGLLAAMNSSGKNFLLFNWSDIDAALRRPN